MEQKRDVVAWSALLLSQSVNLWIYAALLLFKSFKGDFGIRWPGKLSRITIVDRYFACALHLKEKECFDNVL